MKTAAQKRKVYLKTRSELTPAQARRVRKAEGRDKKRKRLNDRLRRANKKVGTE